MVIRSLYSYTKSLCSITNSGICQQHLNKTGKNLFKEVKRHCKKEQGWAVYELAENVSCQGLQRKHALCICWEAMVIPDFIRSEGGSPGNTEPKIKDFMKPHESFHLILMAAMVKHNVIIEHD